MSVREVQTSKRYMVWAEHGRIYLTVHERGRPIVKADWSMAEIDTALNALREEVVTPARPLPRVLRHETGQDAG